MGLRMGFTLKMKWLTGKDTGNDITRYNGKGQLGNIREKRFGVV